MTVARLIVALSKALFMHHIPRCVLNVVSSLLYIALSALLLPNALEMYVYMHLNISETKTQTFMHL